MAFAINSYIDDEEKDKQLISLAEQAGLVYTGKDIDGDLEFIGDSRNWQKYEELKKENNL